ncbi:MAG: FG-GAP-like repeat-containing protein, partial [Leptospirales bacterium]
MRNILKVFPLAVVITLIMVLSQTSGLNASVSPDGSFSKQVGIEIPPGRNGIQPSLSLVYNSNGANGIAGAGWSISGFGGAITKDNRFYSDRVSERSAGVQQFAGPGGRLVEIDRAGLPGVYHYERENYSEISFDSTCNGGLGCWVETLANGSRVYYGEGADHILLDSSGKTYAWLLSRVEDVYKNGYRLTYEIIDNVAYPKMVEYTTHPDKSYKLYGVEFHYVNREDVSSGYSFGVENRLAQRLDRVTVYSDISCGILSGLLGCSGNLIREYRLSYQYGFASKKSLLVKVEEAGSNEVVGLPGQTFTYSDFTPGWSKQSSLSMPDILYYNGSHPEFPISIGQFVDVNGDGRVDWVRAYRGKNGIDYKAIWLNTVAGWVRAPYNLPDVIIDYNRGHEAPMVRGQFVDVNADGLPDWVRAYTTPEGRSNIATYLNTGTGWTRTGAAKYDLPVAMVSYSSGKRYPKWQGRFIDVNGDSRVDWVRAIKPISGTTKLVTYLNTTSGWAAKGSYALPTPILDYGRGKSIAQPLGQFADVNGDGLPDWVRANNAFDGKTRITTYINTGKGWKTSGKYKLPTTIYSTNSGGKVMTQGRFIDINGDGLVDWVQSYRNPQGGLHRDVWLNSGKGWKKAASSYRLPNALIDYDYGRNKPIVYGQLIDVNSDGLPDWVEAYRHNPTGTNKTVRRAWLNTGSGWQRDDSFAYPGVFNRHQYEPVKDSDTNQITGYEYSFTYNYGQFADISADGMPEWVQAYDSKSNIKIWSLKNQNTTVMADRLIQVDNGIGGVSDIEYESATHLDGAILAEPGTPSANGGSIISNRSPRKLVVRTTQTDSMSEVSYSTRYEYNNGRILVGVPERSANAGFESVTTVNEQTGAFSTTWSNDGLDDYRLAGSPEKSESYAEDGSIVQFVEKNFESKNVFENDNNNDGVPEVVTFVVRPASNAINSNVFAEHASSYEPGTGGTVTLQEASSYVQYDDNEIYGKSNPIQSKQVVTTNTGDIISEKSSLYEYNTFAKAGHPLWQKTYAGGMQVSHTEFGYTGYKLTAKDNYSNAGSPPVTSKFEYDTTYGLLISQTDPGGNTTTISYDLDYNTYPVSITNALTQKITRTYNFKFGKVKTETDYNGSVFTKNYDNYGRLTEEVGPDGVWLKRIDYHDDDLWLVNGAKQFVEVQTNDESADNQMSISRRYFDGLGRVYREETEVNADDVSISRVEYNAKGQVWK